MPSTDNHFMGAIPPESFLERFVSPAGGCAAAPQVDFSRLKTASGVQDASEALIRAAEKHRVCPGSRLFVTKVKKRSLEEHIREQGNRHKTYGHVEKTALCPPLALRRQPKMRRRAKGRRCLSEYYNFANAAVGFEILCPSSEDPFCDPEDDDNIASHSHTIASAPFDAHNPKSTVSSTVEHPSGAAGTAPGEPRPFLRSTPEAAATRSRLVAYAGASFARQHCCSLFQVVVIRDQARFLRWDRSGVIVSRCFSVAERPYLAEFLWRFDHMSNIERGWDTSAIPATRREANLFEDALRDFLGEAAPDALDQRKVPDAERSLDPTGTYPTWKIRVTNEVSGESTDLVVQRPFAGHQETFGRATRAYLALDLRVGQLVFLKDAWRADDPRLLPEFRTYQELRSHDVPFIPYPSYGGDVRHPDGVAQATLSHLISGEKNAWRTAGADLEGFIHHRLVQEIAYPLQGVRDVRELMQVTHDALIALDHAYRQAGIIHRDLSALNIMLSPSGQCVLSDWDHAGTSTQPARGVGTAPFMSARLLEKEDKINEHVDDLESVFWVFLYIAIVRFAQRLDQMPLDIFRDPGDQRVSMGMRKCGHLCHWRSWRGIFKSEVFMDLVRELASSWAQYQSTLYLTVDTPAFPDVQPVSPEKLKILDLADKPSFWIEKIAQALQEYDNEQADAGTAAPRVPPRSRTDVRVRALSTTSTASTASRKRKASTAKENQDGTALGTPLDCMSPREPKRQRTVDSISW